MQKIGRYEVIRELGRGGMATVFLAYDPSFARQVAVEVLPPQFTHDPQFRVRFEREAKVIASLEHAYIVPVYDYGEEGDQPFIVMRYMPGGTLADRMAGKPLPSAEIVRILERVAEALDEAHGQSIVHRDLKPSNIMFDARGHAFLSDFGIAKLLQSSTNLTGSGVIGTPAYMSPEQATGIRVVDGRSDVYAFGMILYEMLTGHGPYEAETPVQLILKHVTEPVPTLSIDQLGLNVEQLSSLAEWNAILARALAKDPDNRYSTAGTLAADVTRLYSQSASLPTTLPPIPRAVEPSPALSPTPIATPSTIPTATGSSLPTSPTTDSAQVSLPKHTLWRFSPRTLGLIGLPVLIVGIGVAVFLNMSGGGIKATPTPTLPISTVATTAPSSTGSVTPAPAIVGTDTPTLNLTRPSATATKLPTSTDTPPLPTETATRTSSSTATRKSPTATRRPQTQAAPSTSTPALLQFTDTPIPLPANTSAPPPANTSAPPPPADTPVPPPPDTPNSPPTRPPTPTQ